MATLALNARLANRLDITVTAGGGETAFQAEVNRFPDFASDESWFYTPAAGGNSFLDLLPDTIYYWRVRKTNAGNGPWSQTYMWATLPGAAAPVPAYNGFSIIPAILVVPEPLADLVATNVEAGSVVDNLVNDDPMSTLRIGPAGPTAITFRTSGRPIDTFAFLGTLANEDVTWRIRGAASAAAVTAAPLVDTGVVQFRISNGIGRRQHYHAFRRLGQTYTHEFWRIDLTGFTYFFMARHLVVGLARSSVNISRGQGSTPMDMGRIERTQFGAPDRVRGWRGRNVEFPLSWISEAEFEAKWRDLDQLVGTTDPVLALPNPKASVYLNDRIAYGEIVDMRAEMMRGTKYARQITVRSLY